MAINNNATTIDSTSGLGSAKGLSSSGANGTLNGVTGTGTIIGIVFAGAT